MTTIVLWGLLKFAVGFTSGCFFVWLLRKWLCRNVELD